MIFKDTRHVKNDYIGACPEGYFRENEVYEVRLKKRKLALKILIHSILEWEPMQEICGYYLDEGQWYNVYITRWRGQKKREGMRIKLTPRPEPLLLSEVDLKYRSMIQAS